MIIMKTCLPRRTVLRGLGATLALPLLDAMVPALTTIVKTAAKPVRRLGLIYSGNGMQMESWTPTGEGAAFEFSPSLSPLAPFRDRLLVITGLNNSNVADGAAGEGVGDHSRGPGTFLTGVRIKKSEGAGIRAGVSMDQIAAREGGKETPVASLELAIESTDLAGMCDPGYSCAYSGTIAWSNPTTPLPMENDPRATFERMFGADGSTDPRVRADQLLTERSILDSVTQDVRHLQKRLGLGDRAKLAQYLEAVRDVERRIQVTEAKDAPDLPAVNQPAGIPPTFEEHIRVMYDLLALAYQGDLTRVFTFMVCRELSPRSYPLSGTNATHHNTSHFQNDPEKMAAITKINTHHMRLFAEFLEKLRTTPDGEGSLLDQVMILYGAGMGNADRHYHNNLPIVLLGGGAGQLQGGRHLRYPEDTPLMNLHATLLDKMGIPVEHLGDSTGTLAELSGV